MITTKDYKGQCWWCGNIADSREHKYKSSDIKREFGRHSYKGEKAVARIFDNVDQGDYVQGASSDVLKFGFTICKSCNSERSRYMDKAYDDFISYFRSNEKSIYSQREFSFSAIFGTNWKLDTDNLKRYFTKHACCRLVDSGIEIRKDVIDFLNGTGDSKSLIFSMLIRDDKADFVSVLESKNKASGYISISDLQGQQLKIDPNQWKYIYSSYDYRGLSILYFYSDEYHIESNLLTEKVSLHIIENEKYWEAKNVIT